jgi:hypothetical protein
MFADQILTNGGFETGTFTGWTVANQAGGSNWFVVSGTTTPQSGMSTVGAAGGLFYAVTDQGGAVAQSLLQSFTVGAGNPVVFSFDMFANNWYQPTSVKATVVGPQGLDFTGAANQHARVDLLTGSANAFDTGAGVIHNFFLGADAPNNIVHAYTHYSFDISSFVEAGGTFQIRFAEVSNQYVFNQGIDNVVVNVIPEPSTLTITVGGLLLLAGGAVCWKQQP